MSAKGSNRSTNGDGKEPIFNMMPTMANMQSRHGSVERRIVHLAPVPSLPKEQVTMASVREPHLSPWTAVRALWLVTRL